MGPSNFRRRPCDSRTDHPAPCPYPVSSIQTEPDFDLRLNKNRRSSLRRSESISKLGSLGLLAERFGEGHFVTKLDANTRGEIARIEIAHGLRGLDRVGSQATEEAAVPGDE